MGRWLRGGRAAIALEQPKSHHRKALRPRNSGYGNNYFLVTDTNTFKPCDSKCDDCTKYSTNCVNCALGYHKLNSTHNCYSLPLLPNYFMQDWILVDLYYTLYWKFGSSWTNRMLPNISNQTRFLSERSLLYSTSLFRIDYYNLFAVGSVGFSLYVRLFEVNI